MDPYVDDTGRRRRSDHRRTSQQDLRRLSQENAAATAVVQQEMNNVQALKRLSLGAISSSLDPDLPRFDYDPELDHHQSSPPSPGSQSESLSSTPISPSQASQLLWVPANVHPELAPQEWKSFVQKKVAEIKATVSEGGSSSRRSSRSSNRRSVESVSSSKSPPSPTLPERSKSSSSAVPLSRRNSRLSRQIDSQDDYTDGSEILQRRSSEGSRTNPSHRDLSSILSLSEHLSTLDELESLAADPFQLGRSLSGRSSSYTGASSSENNSLQSSPKSPFDSSNSASRDFFTNTINEEHDNIALSNDSDQPIFPGASGSLRRATRNKYSKPSLKGVRRQRSGLKIDTGSASSLENESPSTTEKSIYSAPVPHHRSQQHMGSNADEKFDTVPSLEPMSLEDKTPSLFSSKESSPPPPLPPKNLQSQIASRPNRVTKEKHNMTMEEIPEEAARGRSKEQEVSERKAHHKEGRKNRLEDHSSRVSRSRDDSELPANFASPENDEKTKHSGVVLPDKQDGSSDRPISNIQDIQNGINDSGKSKSKKNSWKWFQKDNEPASTASVKEEETVPSSEPPFKDAAKISMDSSKSNSGKSLSSFFSKMMKKDANHQTVADDATVVNDVEKPPLATPLNKASIVPKKGHGDKNRKKISKSQGRYRSRSRSPQKKTRPTTMTSQIAEMTRRSKIEDKNDPRSKSLSSLRAAAEHGQLQGNMGDQIQDAAALYQYQQSQAQSQADFQLPYDIPAHQVSDKSLVMMYHRYPIHIERAIYRLSHLKLANPRRPLVQQVLLSNFMYAYLNLLNHGYRLQHQQLLLEQQQQYGYDYDSYGYGYEGDTGMYEGTAYDNFYQDYAQETNEEQTELEKKSASSSSSSSSSGNGEDMWTGEETDEDYHRHRRTNHAVFEKEVSKVST